MDTIYMEKCGKAGMALSKRLLAITMLLFLSVMLSACSDSRPPEQIVKERSQQRLDALLKGDIATALEFTTPAYQQMTTVNRYNLRVQGAGYWSKAIVSKVECDEDVCNLVSMVTYKHPSVGFENTRLLDEKWLKIDGQWWLYQH